MKAKHGKSTFFVVMMTLLLCGVLAIGATYAYEAYTLTGEEIKLGDGNGQYNVDLISYNKNTSVNIVTNGSTTGNNAFLNGAILCPGRTEIIYLKVRNNESNPLLYSVTMDVESNEFGDKIKCVLVDDLTPSTDLSESNWNSFSDGKTSVDLTKNSIALLKQEYLGAGTSNDNEHCFALAIHMDESATNTYQGKELKVSFTLQVDSNDKPDNAPTSNG